MFEKIIIDTLKPLSRKQKKNLFNLVYSDKRLKKRLLKQIEKEKK